jgi:glutathione S-transferase
MTLTIYGSPNSRTMRVLWIATELGLTFEHIPYEFDDPALKQPAFLKINSAGAIPTITDDGLALSESMAINLYLAKKYQDTSLEALYPIDPNLESKAWQWSLWAQGHLEPWVQKDLVLVNVIEAIGSLADQAIYRSLDVLDTALSNRNWLIAEHFTVADLNVAAVLSPSRSSLLDMSGFQNVEKWLLRCYARPACLKARSLYAS